LLEGSTSRSRFALSVGRRHRLCASGSVIPRRCSASIRSPSFLPHSIADRLLRNLNNGFFDGARPRSDPSGGVAYPWPRRAGRPLALRCRARVLVPRICFGHRTRAPCAPPVLLSTRQLVRNTSHVMLVPCSTCGRCGQAFRRRCSCLDFRNFATYYQKPTSPRKLVSALFPSYLAQCCKSSPSGFVVLRTHTSRV